MKSIKKNLLPVCFAIMLIVGIFILSKYLFGYRIEQSIEPDSRPTISENIDFIEVKGYTVKTSVIKQFQIWSTTSFTTNANDIKSIKCSQYLSADSVLNVLKNFNKIKCE